MQTKLAKPGHGVYLEGLGRISANWIKILSTAAHCASNVHIQQVRIRFPMVKDYPEERTALFIVGTSLYSTARNLNFDIDYRKLLDYFRKITYLKRAFYYTALMEDQEYSPIRPLIDWLDYNGFTMITKPTKEFTDATGRRKIKGNMDIELAIDAMEMASHVDHIVLFSGDGDFRRLVDSLQRQGVRVTVVSTIRTQPPMVADELRRQADHFVDLTALQPYIERAGGRPQRPMDQGEVPDGEDEYYDDDEDAPAH
jgi:uncharacterized LabA/DUF88 family protein